MKRRKLSQTLSALAQPKLLTHFPQKVQMGIRGCLTLVGSNDAKTV
jgi:hypothetical protein